VKIVKHSEKMDKLFSVGPSEGQPMPRVDLPAGKTKARSSHLESLITHFYPSDSPSLLD
jgi:hypothetical protein